VIMKRKEMSMKGVAPICPERRAAFSSLACALEGVCTSIIRDDIRVRNSYERVARDAVDDPRVVRCLTGLLFYSEEALPPGARLLFSDGEFVAPVAALTLALAAHDGADIREAIPALANCVEKGGVTMQKRAAQALSSAAEKGADISIAFPSLVECIREEDQDILNYSSTALQEAAKHGADMRKVICGLAALLTCGELRPAASSARLLAYFARAGICIGGAVPALSALAGDRKGLLRENAAITLYEASRNGTYIGRAFSTLSGILEHAGDSPAAGIVVYSAMALMHASGSRSMLARAVCAMEKSLGIGIRTFDVGAALAEAARKGADVRGAASALAGYICSDGGSVRDYAVLELRALLEAADAGVCCAVVGRLQEIVSGGKFGAEARKGSDFFIDLTQKIGDVMAFVEARMLELEEAA
jgi:hypothetical protein